MHLDEVDLTKRLANACLLQPQLPAPKNQRNLTVRIHGDQLLEAEHRFGRVSAGESREIDLEIAVRLLFGDERRENRSLTLKVIGQFPALLDIERHAR